jgi:hypothetical protein
VPKEASLKNLQLKLKLIANMSSIDPKNLLKELANKELPISLGEYTLDKPELVEKKLKQDKLVFSFGVTGKAELLLFNDANDFDPKDPDEVLGVSNAIVLFDSSKTWLKYVTSVGIKTESGLEVEQLGFSVSDKRSIDASSYRIHAPTEIVGEAILRDLAKPRTIFSEKHILDLAIGEAVTFNLAGTLEASVKVAWSDIFSTNLKALGELLNRQQLFKIKIGAEASASFSIKVEDSFEVKIARQSKSLFSLNISKSYSRAKTGSVGLKVGAEFENKADIEKVLSNLIEGTFDTTEGKLNNLISKKVSELTGKDTDELKRIADRLGILPDGNLLAKVKQRYDELQTTLKTKITELAKLKVSAGFAYDYSRIKTGSVLLEAKITNEGISRFHTDILKRDVKPLIASILSKEGILTDAKFVQKEVTEKIQSSGFSIGFGKWAASSNKKIAIKEEEQLNEKGDYKLAYEGKRSYSEKAGGDGVQWKIDLDAEMNTFSPHPVPYANEFDYGLYLSKEWTEKRVAMSEVARITDQAAVWGIIQEGAVESEAEKIYEVIKDIKNVIFSCEMKIAALAFEPMLAALVSASQNTNVMASALAKAMPRWADYAVRSNITLRTQYYSQLWKAYLADGSSPEENTQLLADAAYRLLKKVDVDLAEAERDYKNGVPKPEAFGFILNANPRTFLSQQRLASGFQRLLDGNSANSTKLHNTIIPKAFDEIEDFWRYPHHFNTLAALIAMVAESSPLLQQYIESTASIKYKGENGKEMVMLIG